MSGLFLCIPHNFETAFESTSLKMPLSRLVHLMKRGQYSRSWRSFSRNSHKYVVEPSRLLRFTPISSLGFFGFFNLLRPWCWPMPFTLLRDDWDGKPYSSMYDKSSWQLDVAACITLCWWCEWCGWKDCVWGWSAEWCVRPLAVDVFDVAAVKLIVRGGEGDVKWFDGYPLAVLLLRLCR